VKWSHYPTNKGQKCCLDWHNYLRPLLKRIIRKKDKNSGLVMNQDWNSSWLVCLIPNCTPGDILPTGLPLEKS
jgi:hypothetical protein